MKTKFLLIGLLCLGLLSCEKDKREKDVSNDKEQEEIVEKKEVRGFLPGVFSVSDTTKVQFSQGNLQYQASTDTWRFAENQWDYVGDESYGNVYVNGVKSNNKNISKTYDGWIDLFGWGTGDEPTKVSTNYEDYSTFKDWGDNEISNGGNVPNTWFTLSYDEWDYLLNKRDGSEEKQGVAYVNGVNGLVLLPDDCTLQIGANYNSSEWEKMKEAGAVFLPAAGQRFFGFVDDCGEFGFYWTSTYATDLLITKSSSEVKPVGEVITIDGESVRLCKIYE